MAGGHRPLTIPSLPLLLLLLGCCGCHLPGQPPGLLEAQPGWKETPEVLPCQKTMVAVSCRARGLPAFPQGLGHQVQQVDISHNSIFSLSARELSGLGLLEQLDLRSNHLQAISEGAFGQLGSLRSLLLGSNLLCRNFLPNGKAFLALPGLVTLDLSANGLESNMAASYLHSLPSLEQLDLSGNQMVWLPRGLFRGVPGLRELSLRDNFLVEIEEGALEALGLLRVLDLAGNSLRCIAGFSLARLHHLNLSYNALEAFAMEGGGSKGEGPTFQLQVLDLSHNHLAFPPLLPGRIPLQHLNLSYNAIAHLAPNSTRMEESTPQRPGSHRQGSPQNPQSVSSITLGLRGVRDLDLSGNRLGSFPTPFLSALPSLRILSLAGNCLQDLSASCRRRALPPESRSWREPSSLPIQKLNLRGNAIQLLPNCFLGLVPQLVALDLSFNTVRLCGVGEAAKGGGCTAFHRLSRLQHLSLRGNHLASVPGGLFAHTPLSSLDLSENEGLFLPGDALEGLGSTLEKLSLRGNRMEASGMNLPCLWGLKILDLARNKLGAWPDGLSCSHLEELDLTENSLQHLEEAVAARLARSLRRLSVAGNPFGCCELGWLEALEVAAIPVLDLNETVCCYQVGGKCLATPIRSAGALSLCPPDTPSVGLGGLAAMGAIGAAALSCFLCLAGCSQKTCKPQAGPSRRHQVGPHPCPGGGANGPMAKGATETTEV